MNILGIDPGSRKTGYAILEVQGRKIRYIDSGVLFYDTKKPFIERLLEISLTARELIKTFSPDEIALESLIYVKSPTALMKLAQSRGAIISSFVETHQGRIHEYSPNLIKSMTTGYGHADKLGIQKSLNMFLGVRKYRTDDESDATAVALCHCLQMGARKTQQVALRERR